jgi:DNA-binding transcriptional MerR regulator
MDEPNTVQNTSPIYNIKAISYMVGLRPVTLRAWERRYGLLHPMRGDQGYRMYSEYDLQTLRWVKTQMETGLSISRAVDHLKDLRTKGMDPAGDSRVKWIENSVAIESISHQLYTSITMFNNTTASEVLRRAFAVYSVDQVLMKVVTPTLVEIGEAWKQGDLPVAIEHYASQFFQQHLMSMLATTMPPVHPQVIIAAGAPGEEHQIGLLMLVVMLRWRGWDIKYLGPNLALERLPEALAPLNPRMLLFSATTHEKARALLNLEPLMKEFPNPAPVLILGGQGFLDMKLPATMPAQVLVGSPDEIVEVLERILESR